MNWSKNILMLVITGILIIGFQYSSAIPSIEMSTSKSVYEYGDLLSITFHVSELTGKQITFYIIDSSGKTSKPINWPIDNLNSTITAPVPFDKTRFKPGTYHITAEYSGVNATTSFDLVDSGRIAIPFEIKITLQTWQQGTPTDKEYEQIIQDIIHSGVINIPDYNNQTSVHIPKWFNNNLVLWSKDSITDNELGIAIQYLVQKGIMIV